MSHFTVLVLLPPADLADRAALDAALERALAPYDENLDVPEYADERGRPSTRNPLGFWDWWTLGGRWRGYFVPREGADPSLAHRGESGSFDNEARTYRTADGRERYRVDAARLDQLDLDRMRGEARAAALEERDAYDEVVRGLPESLPWSRFLARYEEAAAAMPTTRGEACRAATASVERAFGLPEVPDLPEGTELWDLEEDHPYWAEYGRVCEELRGQRLVAAEVAALPAPDLSGALGHPDLAGLPEPTNRHDAFRRLQAAEGRAAGQAWDAALSYSLDRARQEYRDQPRLVALRESERFAGWVLDDPTEVVGRHSREAYGELAAARALPGYATLDLASPRPGPDGAARESEWLAPGRMGWFGASTDGGDGDPDGDAARAAYLAEANARVDALPALAWLAAVDCHV